MSDYAYVAGRVRSAQSAVSALERALTEAPEDHSLQLNLRSAMRRYERSLAEMKAVAELNSVALCDYRLSPVQVEEYAISSVARSILSYQSLFSQVYAALRDRPKQNVGVPREMADRSALDFGYMYSGSLGFVFLAKDERNLFREGDLDEPATQTVRVMFASNASDVRAIAEELGRAVAKCAYDWFNTNANANFSADIKWHRSDGRVLGGMVENSRMQEVVWDVQNATEKEVEEITVQGTLVGGDVQTNSFHLVVPNGPSYNGHVSREAILDNRILNGRYEARIRTTSEYQYATDKTVVRNDLLDLTALDPNT